MGPNRFGPRGTGKSRRSPEGASGLDSVHRAIETRGLLYALTGSSARKLKRGGANLLAGRAFVHPLHPLTHREIGSGFDLEQALHFGTLPKILGMESPFHALERTLTQSFGPGTYAFGNAFEHFIIMEVRRLAGYGNKDWRLSYLRTKDDAEIDLIIGRPGHPRALVEIKSKERVGEEDVRLLNRFVADIGNCHAFCLSRDPIPRRIGAAECLPWQAGLRELGC